MRTHWNKLLNHLLAGFALAGSFALQAGETNVINNSNFDNLAPTPAWFWENWSRTNSSATYDGTRDAGGGAVNSGSLRLTGGFTNTVTGWQEAVFSLDCADFNASNYVSISFDLRVDPSSTPRAGGDYGNFQIILRNGNNWDWKQQTMVPLTTTDWQRFTVLLAAGEFPIGDIRAFTVRIAQNDMLGPVTVNLDNIAFNDEVTIDNFNDGNIDTWIADWGTTPELGFSALDFYSRATSGTLRVAGTNLPGGANWQQIVVTVPHGGTNDPFIAYSHVNVDVKVDPGSLLTRDTNYGLFEIKVPGGATIGGLTLTTTNWTHLSAALGPALGNFNSLLFQLGADDFQGPVTYTLDNLTWTPRPAVAAPPTLSLRRSDITGLKITASGTGSFQRDNIASISAAAQGQWIGSPDPVTYSLTIAEMPLNNSFQVHLFLVPNSGTSGDSDWNDANIVFLDIRQNANGSGAATFRHKTNAPGSNAQLYGPGVLTVLNAPAALGTWSLQFVNDTNITVSGPGGATTNIVMPPDNAAFFAGPITASVGIQPNTAGNVGASATFSRVTITSGSTTNLDDTFNTVFDPTQVDPSLWERRQGNGGDINGITVFLDRGWLVSWLLPDTGFNLLSSSNLSSWYNVTNPVLQAGASRRALVPDTTPPAPQSYFRLINTNSP